jgi:hypothetical protein
MSKGATWHFGCCNADKALTRTSLANTVAPAAKQACVMANPMPDPAPAINTTRPEKS